MSRDIFEILKEKEQEAKQEKKFYVYYNPPTGEIVHFRNYLEQDSLPFIIVSSSELDNVENFNLKDYLVIEKNKKMKLVNIDSVRIDPFNIYDLIYQVPKVVIDDRSQIINYRYDIVIEQNNNDQVFRLKFSSEVKENFMLQPNLRQLVLNIYVTAENDPHILYQTLEFRLEDLLDNHYHTIKYDDFNGDKCNLFSKKYFQTYLHADIR
jgi:hypothetical protein